VVDALLDRIPNPAQQANTQPAAQDTQQDPKPTAEQEGTKRGPQKQPTTRAKPLTATLAFFNKVEVSQICFN
jgi:hypothetical protein